jgi:hypothetical protein
MIYPDRVRLPFRFDPALLVRDLENLSTVEWTDHFVKDNYDGDWSAIPLRSVVGAIHPIMMIYSDPCATAFEDTPMLAASGYFRGVLDAFACEVRSVRLMRLRPGSVIKEHCDLGLDVENGWARIHIPITTGPSVEFEVNRSRVFMEPGEAWYLRFSDPHRVANKGSDDRVHLVLDTVVNDWLTAALDAGLSGAEVPSGVAAAI